MCWNAIQSFHGSVDCVWGIDEENSAEFIRTTAVGFAADWTKGKRKTAILVATEDGYALRSTGMSDPD